jgi:hypothetical protein
MIDTGMALAANSFVLSFSLMKNRRTWPLFWKNASLTDF